MAEEDLNTLGFAAEHVPMPGVEAPADGAGVRGGSGGEVVAGLAAAKKRKVGILFGMGSGETPQRGGGH